MNIKTLFATVLLLSLQSLQAAQCPDPQSSSLAWGEIPSGWEVSPFSPNRPQADKLTAFSRANILVAGLGRGVSCTYQNSLGPYIIWKQAGVHVPASIDYNWHKTLGGFECTASLTECIFYF